MVRIHVVPMSFFVSFVLHTKHELALQGHDAVRPQAGAVRFSGFQFVENDSIDGDVTWTNVIMGFECEKFGILDGLCCCKSKCNEIRKGSWPENELGRRFGILDWLRCCESRRNEIRKGSWPENGRKRPSAACRKVETCKTLLICQSLADTGTVPRGGRCPGWCGQRTARSFCASRPTAGGLAWRLP